MSEKAKSLLKKMAVEYDCSGQKSFDSMFYISYPEDVLTELYNHGYITTKNDINGTIVLTDAGYNSVIG